MKTQIVVEMSTADVKGMCTDNNCGEQVLIINGPNFNITLPRETIEAGMKEFQKNDRLMGRSK